MDKLCEGIKEEMGQEFVSCISTPNGVEFSAIEYCYVVYIPENKKWFYLTNTDESAVLVNKIIPAEIREKLHR
jgi:hypothetical protein